MEEITHALILYGASIIKGIEYVSLFKGHCNTLTTQYIYIQMSINWINQKGYTG